MNDISFCLKIYRNKTGLKQQHKGFMMIYGDIVGGIIGKRGTYPWDPLDII